jgi:RHS repeat-associated protein
VLTINPAGVHTSFRYDLRDRLRSVTNNATNGSCVQLPCNVTTGYEYDRAGNQITMRDANNQLRRMAYDAADRQVAHTDALQQTTNYDYDRLGQLIGRRDPRGASYAVTYSYDGQNRPTSISAGVLSATIQMQYNALGWRTALTDGTGTTSFSYDDLGRITGVTAPGTGSVGYLYDARGQRIQLTYPNNDTVGYTYRNDGQRSTVTQGNTILASYDYTTSGLLNTVRLANGVETWYSYDSANRLTGQGSSRAGNTITYMWYSLDRQGLQQQALETFWNGTITMTDRLLTYGYDGLQRLISTTIESPMSSTTVLTNTYDPVGNRTSVWENGGQREQRQYNAANQVVGWSYDAVGNLLSDGSTSSTWDALGRLVTQGTTTNAYNGDGVLVQRGATRYTQDLAAPLSQVLAADGATFVYGHERLSRTDGLSQTWYLYDMHGSLRMALDDTGAVAGHVSYDPWGVPDGPLFSPFGYTGELTANGLVYLRARWYHPATGIFTARDPWAGDSFRPSSLHKYAYAENDPINAHDPTGLATFRVWTSAFIRPKFLAFTYLKGQWLAGLWGGDDRDSYDMKDIPPSSRIFAEVTVDTDSPSGAVAGSVITGVGETVVHYLDNEGRVQEDRETASDEARVRVARDGNYILVRITNRGPNPLTPSWATPLILYDYNVVFDLDRQRVLVGGETSAFPSHEIHIETLGRRVFHPNYAGGTNPLALYIPPSAFEPIEAPVAVPTLTCPSRNRAAWSVLDVRYRLSYLARFFPEGLPWETF